MAYLFQYIPHTDPDPLPAWMTEPLPTPAAQCEAIMGASWYPEENQYMPVACTLPSGHAGAHEDLADWPVSGPASDDLFTYDCPNWLP